MPWFCSSSMAFSSTGTTGEPRQMRAIATAPTYCSWNVVGVICMTTGVEMAPQKLLVWLILWQTTG